jgi:hypothetical protein
MMFVNTDIDSLDIIHLHFFKQLLGDWTLPPSSGKRPTQSDTNNRPGPDIGASSIDWAQLSRPCT